MIIEETIEEINEEIIEKIINQEIKNHEFNLKKITQFIQEFNGNLIKIQIGGY